MPQFEQASEIFRTSWGLYSKVVEHDYMSHQRLNSAVRAAVMAHFGQHHLRLIELGCGDAAQTAQIFRDLPVDDYQGCDLSDIALDYAKGNLSGLAASTELVCVDLLSFLRGREQPVDIIYASFALHHLSLPDKQDFAVQALRLLKPRGLAIIVDVFREAHQSRPGYLDAYLSVVRDQWHALDGPELAALEAHVRDNDFPETVDTYLSICEAAGLRRHSKPLDLGPHKLLIFERVS